MADKVVLVTGGAGFIGSELVRHLLANTDWTLVNVDALTYAGNLDSLAAVQAEPRHRFEQVDIRDAAALARIFAEHRPDAVMHLAAESHVDRSIDGPADFIQTNVVGTFNLLEAALRHWQGLDAGARGGFRFLHVSTDEVYGALGTQGSFTENTAYDPRSPYSASKAASDHLVRAWHHTYGLPVLLTNCSNNYGPYQFPEKLIPLTILNALAGQDLPVYGRGENVRDWLHVTDHARALRLVLEQGRPGRTYNVGGHNERTNLQVVEAICALLDELRPAAAPYREQIRFVADRPGHDFRYSIDPTRLMDELGWRPLDDFNSGLRKTVQWYLDNADWCRRVQDGSYQGQRLGLARDAS